LKLYWKTVLAAYLSLMGIILFNITIPQFMRWIVDEGIRGGDTRLLALSVLGLLGLTLVKGILTFVEGRCSEVASQNVAYDVRNDIQRKLTILSFSYHDQTETGDLLSRAVQDVERIRFLTGRASMRIIDGSLLLLGTSVVLLWMNAPLALLVLATMPLLISRALYFGKRFRPLSAKIQQQLGSLTTQVEQNLRGAQVVKAFAQKDAEIERFDVENDRWFELSTTAARLEAVNIPMMFLIANLGMVFIIWYGGRLVIQDALTLGELVAFTAYIGMLVDPVRRLGMIIPAVAMAGSAAERIFEILDAVSEVGDAPDARELPPLKGRVKFEDVSFSYGKRKVLRNIDFEAQPGQMVALLGPTGSGKTSIVNLIPRFYDPTSGKILVDGWDVRRVTLNSLRSQIGIVLQESILFAASVRENIAFGRPGCSEAEIVEAAKAAQAHDFIMQMPGGYDARVGERGVTLSGGQKQRLAIARAMLMDPHILILDDSTASVDTETEELIQEALQRLMKGRTTFVIAHRLSTVRQADLILVLEKGSIAACGTHEQLLQGSPVYVEVFNRQLKQEL
jgi:ATP-binding cassette subfamily B protein